MASPAQNPSLCFKCGFHRTIISELFLRFFEGDVLAQFSGVFLVLYFALDELLVLARPIDLAGLLILELYE